MAEGILKDLVNKNGLFEKYKVHSAGISAQNGQSASLSAIKILKEIWDIDIKEHRAKMVTEEDLSKAKVVLVMTRDHRMILAGRYSKYAKKIFTVKQIVDNKPAKVDNSGAYDYSVDVPDPYGMPEMIYRRTAEELHNYLTKFVDILKSEK